MEDGRPEVVVAGHICLDIIPDLGGSTAGGSPIPPPGRLAVVGPAVASTGGCVSNTGLALQRLGIGTILMGKVGDDLLGRATVDFIRQYNGRMADGMIVAHDEHSSYTFVVSPPAQDRSFMHFPGPNDTFVADDVDYGIVSKAQLFHFGYPPLMQGMFEHDGKELEQLLRRIKETGATTSLDMAQPDPQSPAGKAGWHSILSRVLPHVDLFLPSLDEILYMLDRERFDRLETAHGETQIADYDLYAELAETLIEMGAAIVCLKLGEQGLYLRSTRDKRRIEAMGKGAPPAPAAWVNRELACPCFQVELAGSTGSGDCTIAGFLAGWVRGLSPAQVMNAAVAVGASNVEQKDAVSGVRTWEETMARIEAGWPRHDKPILLAGWSWNEPKGVWDGPRDKPEGVGYSNGARDSCVVD